MAHSTSHGTAQKRAEPRRPVTPSNFDSQASSSRPASPILLAQQPSPHVFIPARADDKLYALHSTPTTTRSPASCHASPFSSSFPSKAPRAATPLQLPIVATPLPLAIARHRHGPPLRDSACRAHRRPTPASRWPSLPPLPVSLFSLSHRPSDLI